MLLLSCQNLPDLQAQTYTDGAQEQALRFNFELALLLGNI